MKLCFSTLGCPNWKWSEILSTAKDLNFDGIELRGIGEDVYMPDCAHFKPENLAASKKSLEKIGLGVSCVSTDCLMGESDCADALAEYIPLAAGLGAKYIRVLGDAAPAPSAPVDRNVLASRLRACAPSAEKAGVTLLVESNGAFAKSSELRALIEQTASPSVAALWDIHHPYRFFGEKPDETFAEIGKYVRHVHVKDSALENGKIAYKMLGYGDLPLKDAFSILKSSGYDGFISLEWTKRWNAELEDAGIVFSHFVNAARRLGA